VDVPNQATTLKQTPIIEWYVGLVWLQERILKNTHVSQRSYCMLKLR
jgi:hypothetical protein